MFSGKQLHAKESGLRRGRHSPPGDLPGKSQGCFSQGTEEKVVPDSRATAGREPAAWTRAGQGASPAWSCGHLSVGQSRLVPCSGNSSGPPIEGFLSLPLSPRNLKEWPTPPSSSVPQSHRLVGGQASNSEQAARRSSSRTRLGRPVGQAPSVPPWGVSRLSVVPGRVSVTPLDNQRALCGTRGRSSYSGVCLRVWIARCEHLPVRGRLPWASLPAAERAAEYEPGSVLTAGFPRGTPLIFGRLGHCGQTRGSQVGLAAHLPAGLRDPGCPLSHCAWEHGP